MKLLKCIPILVLSVLLIGCSHKVSQETYNKISDDMSLQEVTKILGKPTQQRHIEIGSLSATAAAWTEKKNMIVIQFINDKIAYKHFSSDGAHLSENK